MTPSLSRWHWALYGALALVVLATVVTYATQSEALHEAAAGIVLVAFVLYVTARIAIARNRGSR